MPGTLRAYAWCNPVAQTDWPPHRSPFLRYATKGGDSMSSRTSSFLSTCFPLLDLLLRPRPRPQPGLGSDPNRRGLPSSGGRGNAGGIWAFLHVRRLRPLFACGRSLVSPFVSSRRERSSRYSIWRFSERCSRWASSASFALRLAGMRIRRRARGSLMRLGSALTRRFPS